MTDLHDLSSPQAGDETKSKFHAGSACLLALNLTAGLILLSSALSLILLAVAQLSLGGGEIQGNPRLSEVAPILIGAAGLAWMGFLQFPSAWYAFRRLVSPKEPAPWAVAPASLRRAIPISLVIFALVLWTGKSISAIPPINSIVLPFLHIIGISLPIAWVYGFGSVSLAPLSPRRAWTAFTMSLSVSPFLILFFESGMLMLFLAGWMAYLFMNPAALETLLSISTQVAQIKDLAEAQRIIGPYLLQDRVLWAFIIFASGIVPLIEETIKPLAVYFFLRRGISPGRGFVLGMACGAGYALFESLLMIGVAADWHLVVLGRSVTSLLHITNSGLVGWGLASLWGSRKRHVFRRPVVLKAGAAFLFAVMMHGLWNGFTLLGAWVTLAEGVETHALSPYLLQAGKYSPYGLGLLTLVFLIVLFRMHLSLARSEGACLPVPETALP